MRVLLAEDDAMLGRATCLGLMQSGYAVDWVTSAEQGLDALIKKPTAGSVPPNWRVYLDKLPADPWGRPYQYIFPGVKGEVDVFSLGADGQAGGDGKNADIGSWQ